MGNHIQLGACQTPSYRASDYELVRLCEHGKIVRIIASGTTCVLRQTTLVDEETHLKLVGRLRQQASKHHTNVLNLTHFESQQAKTFCSDSVTVAALFEYSETSLETELRTRQKKRIAFSEADVQSIMIMLVDAMNEVKLQRVRILPRNVLVMEDKTLRLVNPVLDASDDVGREAFHPPELLQASAARRTDQEKAVVWQIGMTILSVMTLKDCLDLYRTDELDQGIIEQQLVKISTHYSEPLISLVGSTLCFDPQIRIDFKRLTRLARDYNDLPQTIPAITISRLENMSQLQTPTLHSDSFVQPEQQQQPRSSLASVKRYSQFVVGASSTNSFHKDSVEPIQQKQQPPEFTSPLQLQQTCSRNTSQVSLMSNGNSRNTLNPPIRSTVFERQSNASAWQGMANSNRLQNSQSIKNSTHLLVPQTHDPLQSSKHNPSKAEIMLQSHGKLDYANGNRYEGNLRNSLPEGFGVLYSRNGSPLYQGFWSGSKYEGDGILYNTSPEQLNKSFDYSDLGKLGRCWLYFRGTFSGGMRQGRGTVFLSNGEYFTGEFFHDAAEGPGKYHCLGGQVIDDIWRNNRLLAANSRGVPTSD